MEVCDVAAAEGRRSWSLERRAWLLVLVLTLFCAMLMHFSAREQAVWAMAVADLLVGLSLAMVVAGGRGGYGAHDTIPLAAGVGILSPFMGYLSDPGGILGRVFGVLEFFVVGMVVAVVVITVNRKAAGQHPDPDSTAPDETVEREGGTDLPVTVRSEDLPDRSQQPVEERAEQRFAQRRRGEVEQGVDLGHGVRQAD
jgi:hypothetical protein